MRNDSSCLLTEVLAINFSTLSFTVFTIFIIINSILTMSSTSFPGNVEETFQVCNQFLPKGSKIMKSFKNQNSRKNFLLVAVLKVLQLWRDEY